MKCLNDTRQAKYRFLARTLLFLLLLTSSVMSQIPLGSYTRFLENRGLALEIDLKYYSENPGELKGEVVVEGVKVFIDPGPHVAISYTVSTPASDNQTTQTIWQTRYLSAPRWIKGLIPPPIALSQIHDVLIREEQLFIIEEHATNMHLRVINLNTNEQEELHTQIVYRTSETVLETALIESGKDTLYLLIEYQDLGKQEKVSRRFTIDEKTSEDIIILREIGLEDVPEDVLSKEKPGNFSAYTPTYADIRTDILKQVKLIEGDKPSSSAPLLQEKRH